MSEFCLFWHAPRFRKYDSMDLDQLRRLSHKPAWFVILTTIIIVMKGLFLLKWPTIVALKIIPVLPFLFTWMILKTPLTALISLQVCAIVLSLPVDRGRAIERKSQASRGEAGGEELDRQTVNDDNCIAASSHFIIIAQRHQQQGDGVYAALAHTHTRLYFPLCAHFRTK